MAPMWKNLMKNTDLDEPTSFLVRVRILGCTQRECKVNENVIDQYREMFESRISAGATEKLSGWEKPHAITVAWCYDVEEHAQKCVERHCELANKKRQSNCTKFQPLAWMITTSRRRSWKQYENYPMYVLNLSSNACTWLELVDLTFFGP